MSQQKPYWEIRTVTHGFVVSRNEAIVTAACNDTLHAFGGIDAAIAFMRKEMKETKNQQVTK